MKKLLIFVVYILFKEISAQTLPLPPRPANALSGSAFAQTIWSVPRDQREEMIYSEIMSGNVPNFLRYLVPINTTVLINGNYHSATYYVTCDYLAVGSDNDYFLIPMTPLLGQRLADALKCTMPTKRMVDTIYFKAPCRLRPQPIPPTPQMITVPVFWQHNDSVKALRLPVVNQYPLGTLVGGTKKDVIISNNIYRNLKPNVPKPVVIYGWHQLNGTPIQPVYNGHEETYVDYSHGIRLVKDTMIISGNKRSIASILSDSTLNSILSDEGLIAVPRYNLSGLTTPIPKTFAVQRNSSSSIKVVVSALSGTTYKAFYGLNGLNFDDSSSSFSNNLVLSNLFSDTVYYVRLKAYDSKGISSFSEVLAASTSSSNSNIIIVNGFDRSTVGNTYNYIRQHASTFKKLGWYFDSATNEMVLSGLISLMNYKMADYILGEESTADETLSTVEQDTIKNFLRNGGILFISGSEIAWDLDYKGTASDKDFCLNFLKTQYINDAPNGQAGVYYGITPIAGQLFGQLGQFYFDDGTHGTYNVRYPDVINGINGGINQLSYTGLTNQFAAVSYSGLFPGGTKVGGVMCMGFPYETIYDPQIRFNLMKLTNFFPVGNITDDKHAEIYSFGLYQNYPNPFNPKTVIRFKVENQEIITLKIFDVLGNQVLTLVNEEKEPGFYEVQFPPDSSFTNNIPSGVYYYQLKAGNFISTKKMVLLK